MLGNHDFFPSNQQDYSEPYVNELIQHYRQLFDGFLDNKALRTFRKYGYYSMKINKVGKVKLPKNTYFIALNTQVTDTINLYNYVHREDPGQHFAWLEKELTMIEKKKGIAFLGMHFAPMFMQHQWGQRYRALMERF